MKFEAFNKKEQNILPTVSPEFISHCAYENPKKQNCPVFLIQDIVSKIEKNEDDRLEMIKKGAIIEIKINWNCNYDIQRENCEPTYDFDRFDFPSKESKAISGFNFK